MKRIEEIKPLLETPKRVVITMHQKPDADAMGSSLALYHYLKQKGHDVTVISPTNFPDFLNWMPGSQEVLDFESSQDKAMKALEGVELLFCLDFNALYRTKNMEPYLAALNCAKILIDHHLEPQPVFDYGVSDTTAASTALLVYETIHKMGEERYINDAMAQCIYAGTVTDTGSFRFASTSSRVHRMVADLLDHGLNHELIHQAIYDNFLENRLRFLGHSLLNRMEVYYEYNTAMIAIPYTDLKRFDLQTGDTEGVVNFLLSIQGIKMAALIIDRHQEVKLSFRSKGDFDVNTFARKYFDGGGHFHAAGGHSADSLDVTVQRFVDAIAENEEALQ